MKTQDEKREEFIVLVAPVMKWMAENLHPHTKTIITANAAELVEGDIAYRNDEFIVD